MAQQEGGYKCPEYLHTDFAEDFSVAIRWLPEGPGENTGNRTTTVRQI
jgi:hypothetical protein